MEKTEIRKLIKKKRADMSKAEVLAKSAVICSHFLKSELYKAAKTIMLYMPLDNEADTTEIMSTAFRDGKRAVLPVTDSENKIMPYYVTEDTQFKAGRFSVSEPQEAQPADSKGIDLVIVPGISFDRFGNRVGFGKGCYDGFLNKINAVKIGACYEFQICDQIPTDSYDVKMDYIITDKGWL